MKKLIAFWLSATLTLTPVAPLAQEANIPLRSQGNLESVQDPMDLFDSFPEHQRVYLEPEQLSLLTALGLDEADEPSPEIDDLQPLRAKMELWDGQEQLDLPLMMEDVRDPEQFGLPLFGSLEKLKDPLRVVSQTSMADSDGSRMAVDFGLISPKDLEQADFGFDSEEVASIRPAREVTVSLTVVVPASLDEQAKKEFVDGVASAFRAQHRGVDVKVKVQGVKISKFKEAMKKANAKIANAFESLSVETAYLVDQTRRLRRQLHQKMDEAKKGADPARESVQASTKFLRDSVSEAADDFSQWEERSGAPTASRAAERFLTQPTDQFLQAMESMTVETAYLASLARSMIQKNKQQFKRLQRWGKGFASRIKRLRDWKNWTTKEKDMFLAGTVVGGGKSSLSISYWLTATGVNTYGMLQSGMSLFMDVFFSAWGNRIEAWKNKHKFPWLKNTRLVRWYNSTPLVKAFIVNNLIGFSAGFYFRLWSYLNNPERVSSPWSFEALGTYLGAMSIGGLIGSAGGQGALTLRRKGWISARQEMLLYQVYGLKMQIEGFLFGSGLTWLYWVFFSGNMTFQSVVYGASRFLPSRSPRALVIHPDLIKDGAVVDSEMYTSGLLDAEPVDQLGSHGELDSHPRPRAFMRNQKRIKEGEQRFPCEKLLFRRSTFGRPTASGVGR